MDRTKKGAVRTVAIAVAAGVLLGFWSAGCEDPLAPFNEITATSGSPQGGTVAQHTHQATIPARFVNELDRELALHWRCRIGTNWSEVSWD